MCKAVLIVRSAIFLVLLICSSVAGSQGINRTQHKDPGIVKPVCSPGAICFSGRVSHGIEFRKELNADLDFVLKPGWTITVVPKMPNDGCDEFASVVNPPYRAHRALYIDTSYGWTAEEEVTTSPRKFGFVTNCSDYRVESDRLAIVMWPYMAPDKYAEAVAKLGTSKLGKGRVWITDSRTSHSGDTSENNLGKIEWMAFSVEIILPQ